MPNDENQDAQEEVIKVANAVYSDVFESVCAERGYTHVQEKDAQEQAMGTVQRLRNIQEKQTQNRNEIAKQADVLIQED